MLKPKSGVDFFAQQNNKQQYEYRWDYIVNNWEQFHYIFCAPLNAFIDMQEFAYHQYFR